MKLDRSLVKDPRVLPALPRSRVLPIADLKSQYSLSALIVATSAARGAAWYGDISVPKRPLGVGAAGRALGGECCCCCLRL